MQSIATDGVAWSVCRSLYDDREPCNNSSAVAAMGDRGHNIHGPKRGGGGCYAPFAGAGTPSSTMWPGRGLLPYQFSDSTPVRIFTFHTS